MAQICGELQREKFVKSITFDDQRVNNNRVAIPVGDEEIDDDIIEPPELNIDDIDVDESDNEDDEEIDDFIRLWFEGLDEEDINEDSISNDEINESLNELLNTQIHPADNNDAKWDLTTLFKSQLVAPSFFSNMSL